MTAIVNTISNLGNSAGIANFASGKMTTDGGSPAVAFTVQLGFVPRYFCWVNATDRITDEWYAGMAADSAIETAAAGTRTLETSGGITVGTNAGTTAENARIVSMHADLVPASKTYYWVAQG